MSKLGNPLNLERIAFTDNIVTLSHSTKSSQGIHGLTHDVAQRWAMLILSSPSRLLAFLLACLRRKMRKKPLFLKMWL